MKIWIVEGATGEYSDHHEWPVKAYKTEDAAKEMVELCSAEYRRIKTIRLARGLEYYEDLPKECIHRFDPSFNEDYSGTLYSCYSVELEEK